MNKQPSGAQNRKKRLQNEQLKKDLDRAEEQIKALTTPPTVEKTQQQAQEIAKERTFNKDYREIPVYGQPPADKLNQIRSLIASIRTGYFNTVSQLADGILQDDRISGALNVRLNTLTSSRIDLLPSDDTTEAAEARDMCNKSFDKMITPQQMSELLRWGLLNGVGFANVCMDTSEEEWIPYIKIWHPRYARYDWATREYKMVTENFGEVFVLHDDPTWLILEPEGDHLPWMRGLIIPLSYPYLMRSWTVQYWARQQEIHGMPIIAGITPTVADPEDVALFMSQLSTLAFNATVRLPQGVDGNRYDIKLIEPQADLFQGYESFLKYNDASIQILLLGQTYSTSDAGGFGSTENPGRVIRQEIRRKDARCMEKIIRDKLLKPWAQANLGDAELAPYIRFDIEDKEDQLKKAQQFNTLITACVTAKNNKLPIDIVAVLADYDVPLLSLEERLELEAEEEAQKAQMQTQDPLNPDMPAPHDDAPGAVKENTDKKVDNEP